jgi:hypothetical protein
MCGTTMGLASRQISLDTPFKSCLPDTEVGTGLATARQGGLSRDRGYYVAMVDNFRLSRVLGVSGCFTEIRPST